MNILDQMGEVQDYAIFAREAGLEEDFAETEGLLGRSKGRAGLSIGIKATDVLYERFAAGDLTVGQAEAIAEAAPKQDQSFRGIPLREPGLTLTGKEA